MEKTANNILLIEFLGGNVLDEYVTFNHDNELYFKLQNINVDDLQFDCDWNFLIPVIKEIGYLNPGYIKDRSITELYDIKFMYNKVIKFVKYFNASSENR